jgi:hypothetical protein
VTSLCRVVEGRLDEHAQPYIRAALMMGFFKSLPRLFRRVLGTRTSAVSDSGRRHGFFFWVGWEDEWVPTGPPDRHRLHEENIRGYGPCYCVSLFNIVFQTCLLVFSEISPKHYDNQGSRGRYTVVYYESIKLELNRRLIYECRCDERLKVKTEGSTRLTYTGLHGGLEHLKVSVPIPDVLDGVFRVLSLFFLFCIVGKTHFKLAAEQ